MPGSNSHAIRMDFMTKIKTKIHTETMVLSKQKQ